MMSIRDLLKKKDKVVIGKEQVFKLIKLNKEVLKAIKSKDPKKIDRAMESHAEKEKFDPLILVGGEKGK